MHVDAVALDDRRRRRAIVLRMERAADRDVRKTSTLTTSRPGRDVIRQQRAATRRDPRPPSSARRGRPRRWETTSPCPGPPTSRRCFATRSTRAGARARTNVPVHPGRETRASPALTARLVRPSRQSSNAERRVTAEDHCAGGAGSMLRMAAMRQPSASRVITNVDHIRRSPPAPPMIS